MYIIDIGPIKLIIILYKGWLLNIGCFSLVNFVSKKEEYYLCPMDPMERISITYIGQYWIPSWQKDYRLHIYVDIYYIYLFTYSMPLGIQSSPMYRLDLYT